MNENNERTIVAINLEDIVEKALLPNSAMRRREYKEQAESAITNYLLAKLADTMEGDDLSHESVIRSIFDDVERYRREKTYPAELATINAVPNKSDNWQESLLNAALDGACRQALFDAGVDINADTIRSLKEGCNPYFGQRTAKPRTPESKLRTMGAKAFTRALVRLS